MSIQPRQQRQQRQQAGLACEQCRKRKLRCDREKPRCGTCSLSGTVCEINYNRLPRGPKQGSLSAVRNRLRMQHITFSTNHLDGSTDSLEEEMLRGHEKLDEDNMVGPSTGLAEDSIWEDQPGTSQSPTAITTLGIHERPSTFRSSGHATSVLQHMDDLMRSDLDLLYFDRVHVTVPIIHRQHYMSWSRNLAPDDYTICLQKAMWTLAMCFSSQFESMREAAYTETRNMLEQEDLNGAETPLKLAHAQAWILLTYYELLKSTYNRAWLSAGRALRLVQLLRLHEVDSPGMASELRKLSPAIQDISAEEHRRTFWFAYCLDRFIGVHTQLPLTLSESDVFTRLPTLDTDFDMGLSSQTCFLSEVFSSDDRYFFSPLAEYAMLATIYGRILSHHQSSAVGRAYGISNQEFWLRHDWLDDLLERRSLSLAINSGPAMITANPMLLLCHLVLNMMRIQLCKALEPFLDDLSCANKVKQYQDRAIAAAREIGRLTKDFALIGVFNAHVILPAAIFIGAERLMLHHKTPKSELIQMSESGQLEEELSVCIKALQQSKRVNNLAGFYLNLLSS